MSGTETQQFFKNPFNYLLLLIPVVIAGEYFLHMDHVVLFFISALSILPLAKIMGKATEELSIHLGQTIGGLLNVTFANAPELIILIMALTAGQLEMAKASITGAIIGNILLLFGLSILLSTIKKDKQSFNPTMAHASSALLMLVVIGLVIPAVFSQTQSNSTPSVLMGLSVATAVILIIIYILYLLFSLKTHSHLITSHGGGEEVASWSKMKATIILLACAVAIGVIAEALVGSVEHVVDKLGWTTFFIGMVILPIIGGAAEYWTALVMATKNKIELSMNIAIGSSLQTALFIAPVLVFVSIIIGKPMNLLFEVFEVVALVIAVAIVSKISSDGEVNWLEGVLLIGTYLILASAFFFHR